MQVGSVKEIMRHPVKSFRGESVQQTELKTYGILGDRSHAFIDEDNNGKYLTITQYQDMARWEARFLGEDTNERYPEVEVISPDGQRFTWGDEELLQAMEQAADRKLSFVQYTPEAVPLGAIEEAPIQLVSQASVEEMERLWSQGAIDWRRFRPNLLLALDEDTPFLEESWYGRELKIGDEAVIRLIGPCERCMIITVDPDSGKKTPSLLKTVAKERRNQFGVYASVVKTGMIQAGDAIVLEK